MNDDTVLQMVMGQMLSRIFTINAQAVPGTAWGFYFSFALVQTAVTTKNPYDSKKEHPQKSNRFYFFAG